LKSSFDVEERDKAGTKETRRDGPLDVVERCGIAIAVKLRERRGWEDAHRAFPRNYQGCAVPSGPGHIITLGERS